MYNYCDYRCEQCWYPWYQKHCPTYKKDKKRLLQHQLVGKDPYDMKVVLEDVKENLYETMQLIKRGAKKWGVDLDTLPPIKMPPKPRPRELTLCRQARHYTDLVHNFLQKWQDGHRFITEKLKSDRDDISWYHTLIPSKLYRAEISLWESKFEDKDSKKISLADAFTSAQITSRSIRISVEAWKNIYRTINDDRIIEYLKILKRIDTSIKKKFKIKGVLTPAEFCSLAKKSLY